MTLVRFACICDRCKKRSEEYTAWPSCRECLDDICEDCLVTGTKTDADVDQPETCLCADCCAMATVCSECGRADGHDSRNGTCWNGKRVGA